MHFYKRFTCVHYIAANPCHQLERPTPTKIENERICVSIRAELKKKYDRPTDSTQIKQQMGMRVLSDVSQKICYSFTQRVP